MDEILFIFTSLFIIIGIETVLLFLIIFKTPAMTFLAANFLRRPIMYIMGKDHLGVFRHFRPQGGSASIPGVGVFKLTENSHTLEYKTKTPIYLSFRDLSATQLPEFPAIIQEVREKGVIINNIDDIERLIYQIKTNITKPFNVQIQSFKTYRFHDLENMFPFNLDPSFIDATVQCEISKGLKQVKNMPMITTSVIIMVMVAAVAIFIIRMGFTDTIAASECTNMVNAAKCTLSNLTGGAFK
jgi:hypothetical protein